MILYVVGGALAVTSVGAFVVGVRLVARGLRDADHPASSLSLARGLRGIVVGVGAMSLAGAAVIESRGLLAFGLVFLAEELYETGVLVVILRRAGRGRDGSPLRCEPDPAARRARAAG